jgi:hypothetical protein
MIDNETRSEISQAIAKAIAYRNCDKQDQVEFWAKKLIGLLGANNLLSEETNDWYDGKDWHTKGDQFDTPDDTHSLQNNTNWLRP